MWLAWILQPSTRALRQDDTCPSRCCRISHLNTLQQEAGTLLNQSTTFFLCWDRAVTRAGGWGSCHGRGRFWLWFVSSAGMSCDRFHPDRSWLLSSSAPLFFPWHMPEKYYFLVPPGPQEAHKASPGPPSHISCSVSSLWLLSLAAMGSRLLQLGHSSAQSGILLLSWDTWYYLGRAEIRSLPKSLEASKSQISPMVSFIQVWYLYLPPRNRRNSLTDESVFKSFVCAPSPRLLKPKTSFSKTISFSIHVRPSQRKWNQNSYLAAWQKVWWLLDTLVNVGKCFKRLPWLTGLSIKNYPHYAQVPEGPCFFPAWHLLPALRSQESECILRGIEARAGMAPPESKRQESSSLPSGRNLLSRRSMASPWLRKYLCAANHTLYWLITAFSCIQTHRC